MSKKDKVGSDIISKSRKICPSTIKSDRISANKFIELINQPGSNKKNKTSSKTHDNSKTSSQRKNKYNAKKVDVDGITFDSIIEAKRYMVLKDRMRNGGIKDLKLQEKFLLVVNDELICTYIADFIYYCPNRKSVVVEDVKGKKTPVYNLKKKLMKAVHDIEIIEINSSSITK